MPNIRAIDVDENVIYLKATGEGTDGDPHVSVFTVDPASVINVHVTDNVLTATG